MLTTRLGLSVYVIFLSILVFIRSLNNLVSVEKGYGLDGWGFDS
jgi:hypothetical protein